MFGFYSKKRLFVILSILAIFSAVFFWENILTHSLEFYVKAYCHYKLSGSFKADAIYRDELGTWVIEKPEIAGHKAIQEGGIDLKADLLFLTVASHFWDRKIDIDVTVIRPNLNLKQAAADIRIILNDLFPPSNYIKIHSKVSIKEAAVVFHDFKSGIPIHHKLYFQLECAFSDENTGCLVASLDDPTLKNNCVVLSLAQFEEQLATLDFNFDEVECAALLGTVRNFIPSLQHVSVNEGTIQGKMSLTFPKDGKPYANGTLAIHRVNFSIPLLELKGNIQEAHLHLSENLDLRLKIMGEGEKSKSLSTIGHLELTKDAMFILEKEGKQYCTINDLKGCIDFQTHDSAKIALKGKWVHDEQAANLNIEGQASFRKEIKNGIDLDLALRLSSADNQTTSLQFKTRSLEPNLHYAQIALYHFNPLDFDLFKKILISYFPDLSRLNMHSGTVDAEVLAYFKDFQLTNLKVDKVLAQNLDFDLQPADLKVKADHVTGNLSVDLNTENVLNTLNADLIINKGEIHISGNAEKTSPSTFQLSELQTKLTIRKGTIESSSIQGIFAGLQGTIDIEGPRPDGSFMKFDFKGNTKEILSLAPQVMQKKLKNEFSNDTLALLGTLRLIPVGLRIEGTLNVRGEKERYGQTLEYGFDLERTCRDIRGKVDFQPLGETFWHDIGMEASLTYMFPPHPPSSPLKTLGLQCELGIAGLLVKNGWLQAQNLPLKKYIEPLLFVEDEIKTTGYGDFHASFDHQEAIISYDLRSASIENKEMCLEIKSLNTTAERNPTQPMPGTYYLDFLSGACYGMLPIINGTYFEKGSGLLFTDISAFVILEGLRIHCKELGTYCNGMYFAGELAVDLSYSEKGRFDVDIFTHTIQGTFSQLQHLFSHFNSLTFFKKFPLEGSLALLDKGASLHMKFQPSGLELQSHVAGQLTEGIVTLENQNLKIKGLQTAFEYDHSEHRLNFNNIHGNLLIGKEEQVETYILAGDHINFSDLRFKESDFDIWIGDSSRDILRLAGQTVSLPQKEDGQLIEFILDSNLTHFGNAHPASFELVLKDLSEIQHFNIEFGLNLETILFDLQRASRTGVFFLSPALLSYVNKIKTASGKVEVNVNYDHKTAFTGCQITGENVAIGKHTFKKCSLQGKKNGNVWSIDQLLLDDISLAADLTRTDNIWKANFLGLRIGESLLLGMEGEYNDQENCFNARVNLLELNLEKLSEWPIAANFAQACHPKGFLRATGTAQLKMAKDTIEGWHVDVSLNSALRSLELKGLLFQDTINTAIRYVSNEGITFKQVKSGLKEAKDTPVLSLFNIEKITYEFVKNEFAIDGFHFNIPSKNLSAVASLLKNSFPNEIDSSTVAVIKNLKQEGNVEGTFTLNRSLAAAYIQIGLKEGTYHFQNKGYYLNNFVLKYNLYDLKILTQTLYKNSLLWLSINTTGPDFNSGLMTVSDTYPEQYLNSPLPGLNIYWGRQAALGFFIHKAEGSFRGLTVHLHSDHELSLNENASNLVGQVMVNAPLAATLISKELAEKMSNWQIKDGYQLIGRWMIEKNSPQSSVPQIHFHGMLEGQNIALKGYQFRTIQSQLDISPQHIQFRQLKLEDSAGILRIEEGHIFQRQDNEWIVNIPLITVADFRPSFLQDEGASPVKQGKPLIVRHLEVENLTGLTSDAQTLTGKGKLQFLNQPKKNLQNTIFAIPGEILTMLGLNLSVLNPVSGTVFYEIKNGKACLTKFKDIYSENKLSKFNLSHSERPSYVDFDGNLDIQIKMRQYNLFFKLAELFTVSVGGTLNKPTYSLNKH
jgi:hypothetical protein